MHKNKSSQTVSESCTLKMYLKKVMSEWRIPIEAFVLKENKLRKSTPRWLKPTKTFLLWLEAECFSMPGAIMDFVSVRRMRRVNPCESARFPSAGYQALVPTAEADDFTTDTKDIKGPTAMKKDPHNSGLT